MSQDNHNMKTNNNIITNTETIRPLVRGFYDLQKLRIHTGNRLCAQFRAKLGLQSSEKEEEDEKAEEVLDIIRASYKKLTDGVKKELPNMKSFVGDEVISDYTELCLVSQYIDLESRESTHLRRIENIVQEHPLWDAFFANVRGCGPTMAGVILCEIDITRATYPSSLWQYSGFGVEADGRGTSRRKEHMHRISYTDKDGKPAERDGIRYNPWLKTKLYVLGTCFVKAGGLYRSYYDNYKNRLENSPKWVEASKGHRHNAAMRYMIKRFLVDLYKAWRPLEGLPVAPEYGEGKLGIIHGQVKLPMAA